MDRKEIAERLDRVGGIPKQIPKPNNVMNFLSDNCSSLAELRVRLKVIADHIVGVRPIEEGAGKEEASRAITVLSRLEDQAFMLNDCFDEVNRIERGLGVKDEGNGIEARR